MAALPDELRGPRLRLVRVTLGDVDEVLDAVRASFAELHDWMVWARTMPTKEESVAVTNESIALFDADQRWSYWLREIEDGALVGSASLSRRGVDGELEIGYWVRSDRTGRGYATEAARVLTDAAFDADLDVARVKISMDRANAASAAVPRKLGFVRDDEYERDVLTPAHSGTGVAWVIGREQWRREER
jgi:RimJ/RimL family protein N-acetyltransferase